MPGILCLPVDVAEKISGALFELKIDGSRITYQKGKMVSDRMVNRNARYPHILKELKKLNWHVRGEVALPGGNILQLSKRENWHCARFYVFDLFAIDGKSVEGASVQKRRKMLETLVKRAKFDCIEVPQKFDTFKQGWKHVKETGAEGLVIKEEDAIWKVKLLKELKVPIVRHIEGKSKGAFLINCNGNISKVSGTSDSFVNHFHSLNKKGKKVFAEIEFPFLTDDGAPFQPRLRRVGTKEDLIYT